MPENRDDRMMLTLDALRRDVERTPLADSLTVRRRGDQRSRRQAVGGALAVVALVAGAVGLYGGLDGDRRATPVPASPTPSTEQTLDLAADPFLAPSELAGLGGYADIGPFIDAGEEPAVDPQECRVRPAGWGASEVRSTRFFQDGSEASVFEYVLRFRDSASAAGALDRIGTELAACPAVDPKDGKLTVRQAQPVDGLPDARRGSRAFVPSVASETHYGEAAAAQRRNILIVLDWSAYGNPEEKSAGWVWDADRLQAALDRAVN